MDAALQNLSAWLLRLGISPLPGILVIGLALGFLLAMLWRRNNRSVNSPTYSEPVVRAFNDPAIGDKTVTLNGRPIMVPAEVIELMQQKRKIEAIKRLRETANLGLAEAKQVVEQL